MPKHDDIYDTPHDPLVKFTFDKQVADVFPDMIQRSVPGYSTIVAMIGVLAGQYAQEDSALYDLGCSLGAATLAMRRHIKASGAKIIAVDNSSAMIERAEKIIARDAHAVPVELRCEDVLETAIKNASVAAMNFTLMFLPPEKRPQMIQQVYDGLKTDGAFILSEKTAFEKSEEQSLQSAWHHAFKKANGYSDLEIAQKRTALENVLVPDSETVHHQRLRQAGFSEVYTWFRCFNFISMVALK